MGIPKKVAKKPNSESHGHLRDGTGSALRNARRLHITTRAPGMHKFVPYPEAKQLQS